MRVTLGRHIPEDQMTAKDEVLIEELRDFVRIARSDQADDLFGARWKRHGQRAAIVEPRDRIDRIVHGHKLDVQALTGLQWRRWALRLSRPR